MKLDNRNKYLMIGIALMLFLSYSLSISKTLTLREEYYRNLEKKESIANLPVQLAKMKQKEMALNMQLESLNMGNTSMQGNLLKFLNVHAVKHSVNLTDFNSPHHIETKNGNVETFMFELEGSYTNILKVLNALENANVYGAVSHLFFKKRQNYRSKKSYLRATVFLEQVK